MLRILLFPNLPSVRGFDDRVDRVHLIVHKAGFAPDFLCGLDAINLYLRVGSAWQNFESSRCQPLNQGQEHSFAL